MKPQTTIKIALTEEQKDQIRRTTGKEVPEVKLAPEELEERLSPISTQN